MHFNCQIQLHLVLNTLKTNVRSELNESKQMVEQFHKAVEETKDRGKEEFSKKFGKLKMTIEKDTETKVVQLVLGTLTGYIKEFEEEFKKMFPTYKVSCYSLFI